MKLFRAMSEQEYIDTMENGRPSFAPGKKAKFFSHSLDFIQQRVRDGRFGKSHLEVHTRNYQYIVEFEFEPTDAFIKLNEKEWMLNVRKSPMVKTIGVKLLVV